MATGGRGIPKRLHRFVERMQLLASTKNALLVLSPLSVACGLLAAGAILAFRALIEHAQMALLPGGGTENYEDLTWIWRLLLPLAGGVLVGLFLRWRPQSSRELGPAHVIHRVQYRQGRLPAANAMTQFFGGVLSIVAGHGVGREGPSVHLGATAGSLLGQAFKLPNTNLRVLAACGAAAAIGASFNTPLAGAAFGLEVILMDYSLAGFLPLMLAAVSATVVTQMVYGDTPAFAVPPLNMGGLPDLPGVFVTGVVMGGLAALFNRAILRFSGLTANQPIVLRATLGGLACGLIGVAVPHALGVGYDTVNAVLLGQIAFGALLVIVAAKLLAGMAALGCGLPGGVIGPVVFIGAAAGAAAGHVAVQLTPPTTASPGFYAMIGMGAMMSAALRAPLAALTALLELTADPQIILPGMLAIAGATLCNSILFSKESYFLQKLRSRGIRPRNNPVSRALGRLGLARIMERRIAVLPQRPSRARVEQALRDHPRWILLPSDARVSRALALPVADVLHYLEESREDPIELAAIPAKHIEAEPIDVRETLRQAVTRFRDSDAEALCVIQEEQPGEVHVRGLLTRADVARQSMTLEPGGD